MKIKRPINVDTRSKPSKPKPATASKATARRKEAEKPQGRLANPAYLALAIREYNKYRRGTGKYMWNEEPSKNQPPPFSPREFGLVLNGAVAVLEALAKERKNQAKQKNQSEAKSKAKAKTKVTADKLGIVRKGKRGRLAP